MQHVKLILARIFYGLSELKSKFIFNYIIIIL